MTPSLRSAARLPAALALAALAAVACTDKTGPVDPVGQTPGGGPGDGSRPPSITLMMDCRADFRARTVTCSDPAPQDGGARTDIIYGGQNKYVVLTSSAVDYDSTTEKFVFNVTVRNLLGQAIGTVNGTSADASGIKVFFVQPPVATAGTGTIAIDNADGTGDFTATGQPYYRYTQMLAPFAVSSAKQWRFTVPKTVTSSSFKMAVSAPVQYPQGWIEISHPVWAIRRTTSKLFTAKVFNQYGVQIESPAPVTWTVSNPALASVPADSGLVQGILPGVVTVTASSTNSVRDNAGNQVTATQTGTSTLTVTGINLTWTQGGSDTDWNKPTNWSPSVTPVAQDSVTVPVVPSGVYPQLVENEDIGQVTVADGASINLGAFNLTASEHVISAPFSGGITSSVGRLFLTGSSKNLSGRVPRLQVLGMYSLTGNVTTVAPLRVQAGRLRDTAFRIRVGQQ